MGGHHLNLLEAGEVAGPGVLGEVDVCLQHGGLFVDLVWAVYLSVGGQLQQGGSVGGLG